MNRRTILPVDLPLYSIPDAAHHIRVPVDTIRSWVSGRSYPTNSGSRLFAPVVERPEGGGGLLSFRNLVELWVLRAIRNDHQIPLPRVRRAVAYLRDAYGLAHPLADQVMHTDGASLFIDQFGQLINIGESGQLAMKKILEIYLERIDRDSEGLVRRLFPFSSDDAISRRVIMIDPAVRFGRPCIAGTGIPTMLVADRFLGGEGIVELAIDFGVTDDVIAEAIRYEQEAA